MIFPSWKSELEIEIAFAELAKKQSEQITAKNWNFFILMIEIDDWGN